METDGTKGVDDSGRIVVYLNKNVEMSPGKAAAQAVHAVLTLLGVHPDFPVVVLGGSKKTVEAQEATVRDAGRTEVKPGTLTAGASFEFPEGSPVNRRRLQHSYRQTLAATEYHQKRQMNHFIDPLG